MIKQEQSYITYLNKYVDTIFNNPHAFDQFLNDITYIVQNNEKFSTMLTSKLYTIKIYLDGNNDQILFNRRTENSFFIEIDVNKKNKKINKLTKQLLKGSVTFSEIEKEYKTYLRKEVDKKIQDICADTLKDNNELNLHQKMILSISKNDSVYVQPNKTKNDLIIDYVHDYHFLPTHFFKCHYDLSHKSNVFLALLKQADDKTLTEIITSLFTEQRNDLFIISEENYHVILKEVFGRIDKYLRMNNQKQLSDFIFNQIFNISEFKNYFMTIYMNDIFNYLNKHHYQILLRIGTLFSGFNHIYLHSHSELNYYDTKYFNQLNERGEVTFYGPQKFLNQLDQKINDFKLMHKIDNLFQYKRVLLSDELIKSMSNIGDFYMFHES